MKNMGKIINWDLFFNAFKICKNYADDLNLNDVNILLLKKKFDSITENRLKKYYDLYVNTEAFYGFPALFGSDVVQIPKGTSEFREYRFFDIYSMVLYNAVGLLFYKVCNDTINQVNQSKYNIYRYVPTTFSNCEKKSKSSYIEVKVDKDYTNDYNSYLKKIEESLKVGKCLIKIDISKYFDSISHDILIELLEKYSVDSTLAEYSIDKDALKGIQFYFESMMGKEVGIPQGRDNCFSDYLGDIYLRQFDFEVSSLCSNEKLNFNCMIRYVDDITILFDINEKLSIAEHHRAMLNILEKISKYLLETLNLRINANKVEVVYFSDDFQISDYIKKNKKKVSTKDTESDYDIQLVYSKFIDVLKKFKLSNEYKFEFKLTNEEKEILKSIFNKNFRNYLCKKENVSEINKIIKNMDLELTTDSIYIMIVLFFLKNDNDSIFFPNFKDNLNKLDILDKRIIHIAMLSYTQNKNLSKLRNNIKKQQSKLINDNYGKYLIPLANYYRLANFSYLDDLAIYNFIAWHYVDNPRVILPKIDKEFTYNKIYKSFIKNIETKKFSESQIEQLKDFVYHYRRKEWNISYNNFYNFFHETCKFKFSRWDANYNITNMIKDLNNANLLTQEDNLNLLKFGDSRNFNSISHPSKNKVSTIKVSKEKLEYYINEIGEILVKLLEQES